jgi:hypothetical protein
VGLAGLALVGAGVAVHATATAVSERRARKAAEKVYLPLVGGLPTRERPLDSAAPEPPRTDREDGQ